MTEPPTDADLENIEHYAASYCSDFTAREDVRRLLAEVRRWRAAHRAVRGGENNCLILPPTEEELTQWWFAVASGSPVVHPVQRLILWAKDVQLHARLAALEEAASEIERLCKQSWHAEAIAAAIRKLKDAQPPS